MEDAAGTGADVDCKEYASAKGMGEILEGYRYAADVFENVSGERLGVHKAPLPVPFEAVKRVWSSSFGLVRHD